MQWIAVAIGGALGAVSRYALVAYIFPVPANRFPLGTLIANLVGCFLIGICYVLLVEKASIAPHWRLMLMTGFLGALTTFSAFALEAVQLWHYGHFATAAMYLFLSLAGCISAAAIGLSIAARFTG